MFKKHLTHKNMRSIINIGDVMEREILHVDVNNAFLSWTAVEMLKNGSSLDIRTIPAVIGGDEQQRKGIVLAKSNLAKQVGIKTGEPIYYARKKCPNLDNPGGARTQPKSRHHICGRNVGATDVKKCQQA